jgi:DNA-binding CsgD family transcriptional regulator
VRVRCEESLAVFRELGEPVGEGFSLHNLAVAAYRDGNLGLARILCEESLAIFRRLGAGDAVAEVLASLGPILDTAGDPASAVAALIEALQLAWRVGPRWVVASILEGIAKVAAGQGHDVVVVELASRAAALRAEIEVPMRPNWRADLERTLATTRATLGQETFDAAWSRGHERPLPDVIAAASEVRIARTTRVSRTVGVQETDPPSGLSPRESDVLRLLVAARSDRDIADALFISPRTASKHVSAILAKLEVASRSEAAIRAVRDGLV